MSGVELWHEHFAAVAAALSALGFAGGLVLRAWFLKRLQQSNSPEEAAVITKNFAALMLLVAVVLLLWLAVRH